MSIGAKALLMASYPRDPQDQQLQRVGIGKTSKEGERGSGGKGETHRRGAPLNDGAPLAGARRVEYATPLHRAREALGFRSRPFALWLGLDPSGFARLEAGKFRATRDTARAIYDGFGGTIPLGMIYDPLHPAYEHWLTEYRLRKIRRRGKELAERYPQLATARARLTR